VYKKELSYCAQCDEFPCKILLNWAAEYSGHTKAVERLKEMKKQGVVQWLEAHGYE
jgi:hypothetical protein